MSIPGDLIAIQSVDDTQPHFISTSLKIAQSWLISFAIHLVILAGLTALVIPGLPIRPTFSTQAVVSEEESEEELVHFDMTDAKDSLPPVGYEPQFSDEAVFSQLPDLDIRLPSSFFGAYVSGTRIAFVIDRSSSMRGTKFDQARDEVVRAVNRLVPSQWFYVVFFDRGMLRMFGRNDPIDDMLPATPENLERFNTWASKLKVGRGTMPYRSIKLVMGMRPDTLFLLTDGDFNSGDKTVDYLGNSKAESVRIHTVGFHHKDDGTLEQIAEKHGGTFRFVSREREKEVAQ